MDGYALSTTSVRGSGPWALPLHGESRAGAPLVRLEPGTICRIFTGAALPPGADAVLPSEDASEQPGRVEFSAAPKPGQHIRRRGEDLGQGELALEAGVRLGAYHVGVAAGVDRAELLVARRPRVTVVGTGDELRAPGEAGSATSIPESNGLSIAILAESAGASVQLAPRIADDPETLRERLARALEDTDLLVTIGGVSIGRYDLVRPALEAAGAQLDFWRVQIKPGKPLVYGRRGSTRILGLPGNPVSAQLTFALFGLPLLRALQGQRDRRAAVRKRAPARRAATETGAHGLLPCALVASRCLAGRQPGLRQRPQPRLRRRIDRRARRQQRLRRWRPGRHLASISAVVAPARELALHPTPPYYSRRSRAQSRAQPPLRTSCQSSQWGPVSSCSRFQIGTRSLRRSISS
jgi:molybdopterin molybdotransferase